MSGSLRDVTPYRQSIRPGDVGKDVLAVKRTLQRMHVPGSGALVLSTTAGAQFVTVIETLQRGHGIAADGIYGEATHALVAPNFHAYEILLYRTAAIRVPPPPPFPIGENAVFYAKRLLALAKKGKYRDDRGTELAQIQKTAAGEPVWSPAGRYIFLDERILEALCWLIEQKKLTLGTYAICTDHGFDSLNGHAGGRCVDISSVNGISVAAANAKGPTLALDQALHATPPHLVPAQLISGGYGNKRDATLSALSIPAADSFYGSATMAQHCNHVHLGY